MAVKAKAVNNNWANSWLLPSKTNFNFSIIPLRVLLSVFIISPLILKIRRYCPADKEFRAKLSLV
jgi:hypothetical protein